MKFIKYKNIILITIILILTSCYSMPVPKNKDGKGYVIVKTERFGDFSDATIGYIRLGCNTPSLIYNIDALPGRNYTVYKMLPAGVYDDWDFFIRASDGNNKPKKPLDIKVEVRPNTITVFPYKVVYRQDVKNEGYMKYISMYTNLEVLNKDEIHDIFESIINHKNGATWKGLYIGDRPYLGE